MIDLHTHTNYSDGTFTVKELLKSAENAGVTLLSITDHDNVNSYIEMENFDIQEYYSGKILLGAEFSVSYEGKRIELLGYGFETDKVKPWLDKEYSRERLNELDKIEFSELYKLCKNKGIKVSDNLDINEGEYPVDVIYYDIIKYEENKIFFKDDEWNNIDIFWRKCSNNNEFILYWDFSQRITPAKQVSDMIKKAGGKVFLAHIFKYQMENHTSMLDNLIRDNIIDGLEVYYSAFSDEQIKFLENYCNKNNLLMSGGTDFHGLKKPDRKIGVGYGNMNIKEDVVKEWAFDLLNK